MNKVPIITGITATGKTDFVKKLCFLAEEKTLSRKIEIVNADAFQVYKYLDIGTAKPPKEILRSIPHYLIDILYPDEEYSAGKFFNFAEKIISDIYNRGNFPIVVGGTGMYVEILTKGIFEGPAKNEQLRLTYTDIVEQYGPYKLYEMLKAKDPEYASNVSANDKNRIIRALEVCELTGMPFKQCHEKFHRDPAYEYDIYVFTGDRKTIYGKINDRVDKMFDNGWVEEVKKLLDMGYGMHLGSFDAIGYRQVASFLKGECTYDNAVREIKKKTRNFAKRQITWFRHMKDIEYIDAFDKNALEDLHQKLLSMLS